MADIKLSGAIRSNLLSLQQTTDLVGRTQSRLSTGLKVSSAIDDAVAFFQSKSLSDRAGDLSTKKDEIDQGVSSLTTALSAMEAVEDIFSQMKGLLLSAKSGTASERIDLSTQFNTLSIQVNRLVDDASYQGLNLVQLTTATLKVSFSEKIDSFLQVTGSNNQISNFAGLTSGSVSVASTNIQGLTVNTWSSVGTTVAAFDSAIDVIDSAITTIRSNAKTLGSNVSLLKTRLDFTNEYVNTLTDGANKLSLADLNEEGANLVALQTRQALATQALAFAGQAEQSVLQLFS